MCLLLPGCGGDGGQETVSFTAEGVARLRYSLRFGGRAEDQIRALAVAADGSVVVAGGTKSTDFRTTAGAAQRVPGGGMDVFVAKFDAHGALVFSTLLGGPGHDRAYGVVIAADGAIVVAGRAGEGFPTTPGAFATGFAGDSDPIPGYGTQDGFVARLAPDGSRIDFATYVGDESRGIVRDLALDGEGNPVFVTSETSGPCSFVPVGAARPRPAGGNDLLVGKLSRDGSRLLAATWLGGPGSDLGTSVAVAPDGTIGVAGITEGPGFPTTDHAFAQQPLGGEDAIAARFSPDLTKLIFATRLGGCGNDGAAGVHGLAITAENRFCVTGYTWSADFPTTAGAAQCRYGGATSGQWEERGDLFVALLAEGGDRLVAATYVGGGAADGGEGIDLDARGRVLVGGFSYSADLPATESGFRTRGAARRDGLAVVLSADLSRIEWAASFAGPGEDTFRALGFLPDGGVVLGGGSGGAWPTHGASGFGSGGGGDAILVATRPEK